MSTESVESVRPQKMTPTGPRDSSAAVVNHVQCCLCYSLPRASERRACHCLVACPHRLKSNLCALKISHALAVFCC